MNVYTWQNRTRTDQALEIKLNCVTHTEMEGDKRLTRSNDTYGETSYQRGREREREKENW